MSVKIGLITDIHHTDRADEAWGGPPNESTVGPVQWRKYSTAEARLFAFCNAMDAIGNVDVCVQLGDIINNQTGGPSANTILEEIVQIITNSDWTGPWYNVAGNHEQNSYQADFSDYEARINNSAYDDPSVENGADLSYSFDLGGIHFIVTYLTGIGGAGAPNKNILEAWLTANLAATNLPVVVFSHALLGDNLGTLIYGSACTAAVNIRTWLENADNVQAVIGSHYHWNDLDTVINNIPYYTLRGSVLSDTEQDSHNAYYLFEIEPNAVYTANGMKANIKITGYEEDTEKTVDFVKYAVV